MAILREQPEQLLARHVPDEALAVFDGGIDPGRKHVAFEPKHGELDASVLPATVVIDHHAPRSDSVAALFSLWQMHGGTTCVTLQVARAWAEGLLTSSVAQQLAPLPSPKPDQDQVWARHLWRLIAEGCPRHVILRTLAENGLQLFSEEFHVGPRHGRTSERVTLPEGATTDCEVYRSVSLPPLLRLRTSLPRVAFGGPAHQWADFSLSQLDQHRLRHAVTLTQTGFPNQAPINRKIRRTPPSVILGVTGRIDTWQNFNRSSADVVAYFATIAQAITKYCERQVPISLAAGIRNLLLRFTLRGDASGTTLTYEQQAEVLDQVVSEALQKTGYVQRRH